MISKLAMLAKKTIEAAWLNGSSYDLATQAAETLESAQLLQSPEDAAELAAFRALDLGTPEGRVSAKCEDATHPVWLRELDDVRGCPWCRVAELEAQRAALMVRLRAGQRWKQGRTQPLVSQDYVSQDELRSIFGIALTAPWEKSSEDPCHPCGCPKRFNRHADGCPTLAAEVDGITRRIVPVQALRDDEPADPFLIYRASWDTMRLGRYTTPAAAREHCEDHARRDLPTAAFDWIEDEEDGVAELVATVDGDEGPTGYTVTTVEVASKYDPEADE
jgi:hypothetical protein